MPEDQPPEDSPPGFLLDDGVFTTIDFPGPSETELADTDKNYKLVACVACGVSHQEKTGKESLGSP